MDKKTVIGVDLGGTKVHSASIRDKEIVKSSRKLVSANGSEEQVVAEVIATIEAVFEPSVVGIGVGVPSVVDIDRGIVYDVQNIPSWKEVHLKQILQDRFQVPVYVNNDANCFAIGEFYFGRGQHSKNMIGLIVGTGMAGGIIINNQLYNGSNCGAGEFGMMPYLEHNYEYYCSGQFFGHRYDTTGEALFKLAAKGDTEAFRIFDEFGQHLGKAIIAILYALDTELIILGGSVSKAYRYYKAALWEALQDFAYSHTIDRLRIEVSENNNIPIMGAAALYYDAQIEASK
ncbi:MAG: ROK family protein [Bacteroidia bacterium]|nr:ROK family protein [Bacteroidia bacterium]